MILGLFAPKGADEHIYGTFLDMFDHIGIFVSDPNKSIPFYEDCLAPLEIKIFQRQPEWGSVIFSCEPNFPFLWVGPLGNDYYGTSTTAEARRPIHLAFRSPSKKAVDDFHRFGLQAGGIENGSPEEYPDQSYNAFLLDFDGNNIEAIYRNETEQGAAVNP